MSLKSSTIPTGAGEQVYAVVKNPKENTEDVEKSYAIL